MYVNGIEVSEQEEQAYQQWLLENPKSDPGHSYDD